MHVSSSSYDIYFGTIDMETGAGTFLHVSSSSYDMHKTYISYMDMHNPYISYMDIELTPIYIIHPYIL